MNDAATARSGAAVLFEPLFVLFELLYWRREITADRVVPLSPLLVLSAASLALKRHLIGQIELLSLLFRRIQAQLRSIRASMPAMRSDNGSVLPPGVRNGCVISLWG